MSIKNFVEQWREVDGERANCQKFWLTFLRDVPGVELPENFIQFEVPVKLKHKKFIDAYFPDTKVIVEQKNFGVDLEKEITQSDGSKLTPFEQARRYVIGLPVSMHPKKIITCNFREFLIYDMETLEPPLKILLEELPEKFHAFDFLIDPNKIRTVNELALSLKAGEIIGKIYDALLTQYINPNAAESLASLNKLCVRLVFCLYAESSGIFGKHKIFRAWLAGSRNIRRDLLDLFQTLNTPLDKRDPYLDDTLKKFPYVNGGLFSGAIEIPNFTPEIKNLLLEEASSGFNWAGISPTIFGAVFESTLNHETRRAGGMHYTSIENIHKVIDPLFLDDLKAQLENFAYVKFSLRGSKRKNFLLQLQKKLSEIKILDPACGSGNFLTESFISLRRIENQILKLLFGSQIQLGELDNPIKVSISQFYGVEINDFAVAVAQTALWIAELQMIQETQAIIHRDLDFLPLKSYANIHEGNALQLDWASVAPEVNYIIGNPPFIGARIMNAAQKSEIINVFNGWKNVGNLDYVSGWYKKATDFCSGKNIRVAFVSTNSICQGDSVATLWKSLFNDIHIDFAHRTFIWDSESNQKAHVHCVIVGFSSVHNSKPKIIFDGDKKIFATNINAYLLDAPNIFVESRPTHIQDFVPAIGIGNKPIDDGNFLFTFDEMNDFIAHEPNSQKYFRKWYGAKEFINNEPRYCLLLKDCPPNELKRMPLVYQRVKAVRDFRLASKSAGTRKLADKPTRFHVENFPTGNYLLIPSVSSENRQYIPIGFMNPNELASNLVFVVPNATLYHFGVLTSSIHMTWLRTVGGRLKSDYRYSKDVVYNNFIWASATPAQISEIEASAQKILDVRAKYSESSLAELYDEVLMPYDLREAHKKNDLAVAKVYGWENLLDDEPTLAVELLKLYEKTVEKISRG